MWPWYDRRVRAFTCDHCGLLLFFENSLCLRCGTPQGFVPSRLDLATLEPGSEDERTLRRCANAVLAACNWMLEPGEPGELCLSCRLTRTRPNDADAAGLAAFATTEGAKRRVLAVLLDLGLPLREDRLRFDLLSSAYGPVTTGHADGVVTIDLAEADDAVRAQRRAELHEPYRTMVGHIRHELGHFYEPILVDETGARDAFRALFGDEREDYGEAIERHYRDGPPEDWQRQYVSSYATMHPWEDWAETFAHYLHIRATEQTAGAFGMLVTGPPEAKDPNLMAVPETDRTGDPFDEIIDTWLPLTYALNAVNRSMGLDDLYPFTLTPAVIEKLAFVHGRVAAR
jgi:hypothetical protein